MRARSGILCQLQYSPRPYPYFGRSNRAGVGHFTTRSGPDQFCWLGGGYWLTKFKPFPHVSLSLNVFVRVHAGALGTFRGIARFAIGTSVFPPLLRVGRHLLRPNRPNCLAPGVKIVGHAQKYMQRDKQLRSTLFLPPSRQAKCSSIAPKQ